MYVSSIVGIKGGLKLLHNVVLMDHMMLLHVQCDA